jgi:uncharacterized protein (TIGR03437 family)
MRQFAAVFLLGTAALLGQSDTNTISFDPIPDQIFGISPFVIGAKATSGLPVSFASTTPPVCRAAGSLITVLSTGTCSVMASQAGNGTYPAATPVTRSFAITAAKPAGAFVAGDGSPISLKWSPAAATHSDFNGDGIPDIAMANAAAGNVVVYLGNGSGGFTQAAGSPFPAGSEAASIVAGDFNVDGFQDLAIGNTYSENVTVLLGDGAGGFAAAAGSPFPVGAYHPWAIAAGDFNGDGIPDLATANHDDNNVTVLLGNGSGSFAATGSAIAVGTSPASVIAGDFNADGVQDLAVGDASSSDVTVLLGTGSGHFTPASGSPFATSGNAGAFVAGDFNGDGITDLAAATYTGITVMLGNSSGGFAAGPFTPLPQSEFSYRVATGDFNGDAIDDLAVLPFADYDNLTVLLGTGTGGFTVAPESAFPIGHGPSVMTVTDFNHDGIVDVAVGASNGILSVFLGGPVNTNATLSTTSSQNIRTGQTLPLTLTLSAPSGAFAIPTGTVTFMDGTSVLGTASETQSPYTFTAPPFTAGSHTLTAVYSGDSRSSGAVSNSLIVQVTAIGTTPQSITFNELSTVTYSSAPLMLTGTASSGLPVVFSANTPGVCSVSGNAVSLLSAGECSITASQEGNATYAAAPDVTRSFTVAFAAQTISFPALGGKFLGISPFPLAAQSSAKLHLTIASTTPSVCVTTGTSVTLRSAGACSITVSQPGNAQYSAAAPVTRSFQVSLAKPSGTFAAAPGSPVSVQTTPWGLVSADFNGDGIQDLATLDILNKNVVILLGASSGQLTAASGSPIAIGASPLFLTSGDFNTDGMQDLLVGFGQGSGVNELVLLGNGSGGFTQMSGVAILTNCGGPLSSAIGDFNGDGIPDIAITGTLGPLPGKVAILLGDGAGHFTEAPGSPFNVSVNPRSVEVADFNGDGIQDLVTASFDKGNLALLLGDGTGHFSARTVSPSSLFGTLPEDMALGDFNSDGKPDLAVAIDNQQFAGILLGNGSGGFTDAPIVNLGISQDAVVLGDFNGDGLQDFAAATTGTAGGITIMRGDNSGGFAALPGGSIAAGSKPSFLVMGDFNGDGVQDLAAVNYSAGAITLLLGGQGSRKTPQQITFGPIQNVDPDAAPFTVTASATSGLTVTLSSSTPQVCTAAQTGNTATITIVGSGICTLTASQPGDANYLEAPAVTQSFAVSATHGGPAINPDGVVPVYSSATTIQPGSWISIYGTHLSSGTATWKGDFPTTLNDVQVSIDGKPGYLYYVSPTQINLQAPDDSATGAVNVTLTNPNGSWTTTVTLAPFAPSFSLFDASHIAGIILRPDGSGAYGTGQSSYDITGPSGANFGFPHPPVAAKPGDTVVLFGVGFGPTNPTVSAGSAFSGAAPTTSPVQLTIGGVPVTPLFSGIGSAGLYQLNVQIPAGLGSGDLPITATAGGAATQAGTVISLQ